MSEQLAPSILPKVVDPRKLAKKDQRIGGIITTEHLPRIKALLSDPGVVDTLNVSLSFYMSNHRPVVDGEVEGSLTLDCLRCLKPLSQQLHAEFRLGIVIDEDMISSMDFTREPWIVPDKTVNLIEAIEDEILLAMPMVVYHDHQCVPEALFTVGDKEALEQVEDKPNPFAALKVLKDT